MIIFVQTSSGRQTEPVILGSEIRAVNSPRCFLNEQFQTGEVPVGCGVVSRHSSTVCLHLGHTANRKQPLNDLHTTEPSREVKGRGTGSISILETFAEI